MPPRVNAEAEAARLEAERVRARDEQAYDALASKQLSNAQSSIPALTSSNSHSFFRALNAAKKLNKWPDYVFDEAVQEPDTDDKTHKQQCDELNICNLLVQKTDGHTTCDLLDECETAREHYRAVHGFFHRLDSAGRIKAQNNLYACTMSSTNTDIYGFISLINQNTKIYIRHAGASVTDEDKRSILLSGLLPCFSDIRLQLEHDGSDYSTACLSLQSHAESRNLAQTTRGGSSKGGAKGFLTRDEVMVMLASQAQSRSDAVTVQQRGQLQSQRKKSKHEAIKTGVSYHGRAWVGGEKECQKFHSPPPYKCQKGSECNYTTVG
jgi:hypothetical protein